jgi:hypothetical protein
VEDHEIFLFGVCPSCVGVTRRRGTDSC